VSRNDPLYGRQADPGTFELRISVQPLERREELAGVRHIEPGTALEDLMLRVEAMLR
jgi:hypothetical protein